jgi:hypothetical protein
LLSDKRDINVEVVSNKVEEYSQVAEPMKLIRLNARSYS